MAMGVVFYTAFYFFLLKSKTPAAHAFGHGLWNALVLVFLVPPTFGFTYVQTSLLWVVALYELLKTKKDRYYDLWALTVGCPVGCLSWAEGLEGQRPSPPGLGSRVPWGAPRIGACGLGAHPPLDLSRRASASRSTSQKSK